MRFAYKNYLLIVLMLGLAWSYVDRIVFGLALQQIKIDLDLTDSQLGFLSGIGFALFFSVMGLPIARWADRGNRVTIVALTTATFSIAVSLCSMASNFAQMFLIRIGIATGEAGCSPPANSLIPDYFNRAERPRASAIYKFGISVGLVIGYFAGGWLMQWFGWRKTFLAIGLVGLVLAAVIALTLKEPRRLQRVQRADNSASPGESSAKQKEEHPGFRQVLTTLWSIPTFRQMLMSILLMYFCAWGVHQWMAAFFIRSHGMATGELGTWLALTAGVGGLLGSWLGGEVASRYAAHNERLQLQGGAMVFAVTALLYTLMFWAPNHYWALGILSVASVIYSMIYGPMYSTVQTLVPANMRATAQAVIILFPTFLGTGFGPLTVGALSDALNSWAGQESLRYALMIVSPGYFLAAWHLLRASRTVTRDIENTAQAIESDFLATPAHASASAVALSKPS